jgi:hypothetical protein
MPIKEVNEFKSVMKQYLFAIPPLGAQKKRKEKKG